MEVNSVANTINVMSLCSGIGGLDLGVSMAISHARTVIYVEREAYCCEVLLSRMEEGRLDPAPIWTDLKYFNGQRWRGLVDIIIAGYPCQPFSLAGKRLGEDDPRHLWPDILRIVAEVRPAACFFENVAGHVSKGLEQVRADLLGLGYAVKAGLFRASDVGAPHRRERLFILATNTIGRELWDQQGWSGGTGGDRAPQPRDNGPKESVADSDGFEWGEGWSKSERLQRGFNAPFSRWWTAEPNVGRVADGVSARVDRLRALGNAVVPQQAAYAFKILRED